MDFNEYQRLALRTYKAQLSQHHLLVNGALGLTGEAGEVAAPHLHRYILARHRPAGYCRASLSRF